MFSLLFAVVFGQAQSRQAPKKIVQPEDAEEHFSHTNYVMALPIYKELLKQEPKSIKYNYRAALCYLNTNIDKSQAVHFLEFITKIPDAKFDNEVWYDLGRAYHYSYKFDEAIKAYSTYKEKAGNKEITKANRQIEMCNNGKELMKFPLNISFENCGKSVNSEFPDYYPLVTKDESSLVFTSRRRENVGARLEFDGYYPSDIYLSIAKEGVWSKAKGVGTYVNTAYDEQAVGISSDGKSIVVYIDHIDSAGNLYVSEIKRGSYQRIVRLNENVNKGFERSGSISPEGDIIFFASDREGGLGETDIYMSRKLPTGQWAKAQNLGANINTPYREDFPFLVEDGKTLYFASQGHSSMGDYDLFKSIWDEESNTWSKPVNLGYPINTPDEERCISFTENNRVGYVSAVRKGGLGDLDIYRVTFNDAEQRYAIVTGYVTPSDSIPIKDFRAVITATDMKTKKEYSYIPSKSTGKYVMALTPGKYAITVEAAGYKTLADAVVVFDMGSFQPEMDKNFVLSKNQ